MDRRFWKYHIWLELPAILSSLGTFCRIEKMAGGGVTWKLPISDKVRHDAQTWIFITYYNLKENKKNDWMTNLIEVINSSIQLTLHYINSVEFFWFDWRVSFFPLLLIRILFNIPLSKIFKIENIELMNKISDFDSRGAEQWAKGDETS